MRLTNKERVLRDKRIRELQEQGMPCREIADQIGCEVSTVYRTLNSQPFEAEIKTCAVPHCNNEFEARASGVPQKYCSRKCNTWVHNHSQTKRDYLETHKAEIRKYHKKSYKRNRDKRLEHERKRYREDCHDELTYLMYSPGLGTCKIGKTVNLSLRLRSLRCGCWDIELVTTFPHGRKLERWLHRRFKANRIEGTEWFHDLTEVDVKNAVAEFEKRG